MKRRFWVVLLMVVLATGQVIAGGQEEAAPKATDGEITLTFLNWLSAEGASKATLEKMVEMFEEDNPGINIELIAVPYSQIRNQALTRATAGLAPDIIQMPAHEMAGLVEAGVPAVLDDVYSPDELSGFFQGDLEGSYFQREEDDEKHLYMIPWSPQPVTFTWNKNLFKAAGLDPETPPTTWSEMEAMAKKISALGKDSDGNQIYGIGLRTDTSSGVGYWFLNTLWAFGGEFVDEEGKIVIDSKEAVEALTWYRDMVNEGVFPAGIGIRDLRVMFVQNQLGMRWGVPAMLGIGRTQSGQGEDWDSQWGAAVMPVNKNREPVCFTSTHALMIAEQSEYKEAAAKFVRALTMDPEITSFYFKEMGAFPPMQKLAESDIYAGEHVRPFLEALKTAKAQPASSPQYMRAMDFLREAVQQAVLFDTDPAKALADAAVKIRLLYNQ